jgi:hypothetical protein
MERYHRTVRADRLAHTLLDAIEDVQAAATRWRWTYHHERPKLALGGIPPAMQRARAASLPAGAHQKWGDYRSSGIYMFECEDGEGYVGQTRGHMNLRLSARRMRLNAHRARITDTRAVTILRTRRSMLDQFEREVHDRLQRAGVRLKNETFAQLEPEKPMRLAEILSPDEEALWVSVPGLIINDEERPLEGERTTRAEQVFEAFEAHPASFSMLRAMGRYGWRTIPNPRKSERSLSACQFM